MLYRFLQTTYNLSIRIRRWCIPPALPRPEGWQRCLPIQIKEMKKQHTNTTMTSTNMTSGLSVLTESARLQKDVSTVPITK